MAEKEKLVVTFYAVDRLKADELVKIGTKLGAGSDITVLPPNCDDMKRTSFHG